MIPISFSHKFDYRQSNASIGSGVVGRDTQDFLGRIHRQEEFERPETLSSMKYNSNEMVDEQQSTIAAVSAKGGKQREQQGDVAVVQPSFDDHESRSLPSETKSSEPVDRKDSSQREGHKRNLSEHFEDATRLTQDCLTEKGPKHRRDYSGDVSNPAQAHRRTDSLGGSTSIQRGKPHRRIDSSGLDALTAAADFSREELAAATAASQNRHSWNHGNLRRSPIETSATFEHPGHGPSPTASQNPPHHTPSIAHHRHYPSLGAPGGLPARPLYYNHSSYPQPPYPHSYHYPPHHGSNGYGRHHGQPPLPPPPPPPPGGYPVQYSRPHGQDPYMKHHAAPLQQPTLERPHPESPGHRSSPTVASIDHKKTSSLNSLGMGPPAAPPQWQRGGSTQGVQTYITGIGAGETTRTLQVNPPPVQSSTHRSSPKMGHHRKLSSLSNLGPLFFGPTDPAGGGGRHHRSTSSSLSFLGALDVNLNESADATFLRNLQESTGTPAAAYSSATIQGKINPTAKQTATATQPIKSKLMAGGTSKRVRRKCTVVGCENRVVQGGLCIQHGAKRKICKHPGCKKHVKKAGLCSAHGPARKRCEMEGCSKVAVQGGRCIAHGAKKKLCSIDQCTKQAILGGMCKKHHDQTSAGELPMTCTIVPKKSKQKPGHTRGLSIFQEISADAVGDLLTPDTGKHNPVKNVSLAGSHSSSSTQPPPPNHRHRSTASQVLVNMI